MRKNAFAGRAEQLQFCVSERGRKTQKRTTFRHAIIRRARIIQTIYAEQAQ